MIRDLVKSDANILHHEIRPCGVNVDRHFIAKTLIENMHHYEGVGLSANQIGMDVRAFAMIRDIEHNEVIVCFNPVILDSAFIGVCGNCSCVIRSSSFFCDWHTRRERIVIYRKS